MRSPTLCILPFEDREKHAKILRERGLNIDHVDLAMSATEKQIQKWIAEDIADGTGAVFDDNPESMSFVEAVRRHRGRPRTAKPKQRINLYIDQDTLAKLRATGRGWQTRAAEMLRKAVA